MPELGLERTAGQRQPEPENAVREDRMVGELHPARAQHAEPPLDLGHRRRVVLLEQAEDVFRHAVHITRRVVLGVTEGDRVPVDKGVLVRAAELVFVG